MTETPATSLKAAIAWMRETLPQQLHVHDEFMDRADIAEDYARRYAGVPATGRSVSEDVALYRSVKSKDLPVLLGLYGDRSRVARWLPGYPDQPSPARAVHLLQRAQAPIHVARAPSQEERRPSGLSSLPALVATPRDAGAYVTMGLVLARDPTTGDVAMSVHRLLIIADDALTIWMLPSRHLRSLHESAVARGDRLPVTINVGAPPAAMVASALSTAHLPDGVTKLDLAGALADQPIAVVDAVSHDGLALAETEIVIEGVIGTRCHGECVPGAEVGPSLPEFLGYDGRGKSDLPVVDVSAITHRSDAMYQAVIGPGREQSVILGLAGALSLGLAIGDQNGANIRPHLSAAPVVTEIHFPEAGGGMLLAFIQVKKTAPDHDDALEGLARSVFDRNGFVKLVVFVDDDVNVRCAEDVFWAMTTRANLAADCMTLPGYGALPIDPSQSTEWRELRGPAADGRSYIDATIPYRLQHMAARSFNPVPET